MSLTKLLVWCLALFLLVIPMTDLLAQQQPAPAAGPSPTPAEGEKAGSPYTMWGLIKAGGEIGFFIIFMSIAMVALVIEYFVSLRRDKMIPQEVLQEIEDLFEGEEYEEVMELCAAEPSFLTNVLGAALPKINAGFGAMMEAMRAVTDEESVKLQQKISWLQLIGAMAPMMGLLGTVTGMIGAFGKIASMPGAPKPKDLAGGIYEALVTTCEGLMVAIPALIFYFYFRNKVVRLTMEITAIAEELLERFRTTA